MRFANIRQLSWAPNCLKSPLLYRGTGFLSTTRTSRLYASNSAFSFESVFADYASQITPEQLTKAKAKTKPLLSVLYRYHNQKNTHESTMNQLRILLEQEADASMQNLMREELETLELAHNQLTMDAENSIFELSTSDNSSVIVEVRAGAGGDEAGEFVTDILEMYVARAANRGWTHQPLSSQSDGPVTKEVVFRLTGQGCWPFMRQESGVHRVQRVPLTEKSGRVHTSTVSVAVFDDSSEGAEFKLNPADLDIQFKTSQGPGGQSVNKSMSCVRIVHIPTGITVTSQQERDQHKNRVIAMKILAAKLRNLYETEKKDETRQMRKLQVKDGSRGDKIRTYQFVQNRLTDHRVGLSVHNLDQVLAGTDLLDEITSRLNLANVFEALPDNK